MLVAGHETTGSVLTWTAYLLSKVLFDFHIKIDKLFIFTESCSIMSTFHDLIENKLRKHMGDMDIFSQLFN